MWIGLNAAFPLQGTQEAICFRGTLKGVIEQLLAADSQIGPVYLSKVYLVDAYMRMWVRVEDTPATAFIIPKSK